MKSLGKAKGRDKKLAKLSNMKAIKENVKKIERAHINLAKRLLSGKKLAMGKTGVRVGQSVAVGETWQPGKT